MLNLNLFLFCAAESANSPQSGVRRAALWGRFRLFERGDSFLATVTQLVSVALTLTAFLFVCPSGHAQAPRPRANRIQVGDIVFDFPPNVHVTSDWTDSRSEFRFHYPPEMHDPTARQVDGLTIYGKDVWPISGTHSSATKWEYGDIQLSLYAINPEVRNALCEQWRKYRPELATARNADFYIFGEDNPAHSGHRLAIANKKFFGAPLLVSSIETHRFENDGRKVSAMLYSLYQPLSMNVAVRILVSDIDIKDISLFDVIDNFETNIRTWIRREPFSQKAYGFDDISLCSL